MRPWLKVFQTNIFFTYWDSRMHQGFQYIQRKSEKRWGKSDLSAFSILKKVFACFDDSVSAAQFLTSRRFRRHPYQYDLCLSTVIADIKYISILSDVSDYR